jgi:mannose-6-phosphate isomerase-like protein (cupin superfamily)
MPTSDWIFSLREIEASLPAADSAMRFSYALRHGSMKIGLYAPRGHDTQGPHAQDELYIVVRGSGEFVKNGQRRRFAAQDVLFVEAGAEHRFESFSEDFASWVIFWGPSGGEA